MKAKEYIKNLSPVNKILFSFLFLISIGTIFLLLPAASKNGISFTDALFTATSAVCVTGLIVLNTAADFTAFGKVIILILIQFGGLGIMTFSVAVMALFSDQVSIKWQFTLQSFYSNLNKIPIKSILKRILLYTFYIEFSVAILLFIAFYQDYNFLRALWYAVFHAISAFCNAGFSTFSDSLIQFNHNPLVILPISIAIILGGIGFIVLSELSLKIKQRKLSDLFKNISLHSKIVLFCTFFLIISGTLLILALEWNNSLKEMTLPVKILNAFFQSVTCRTAGFNSVNISSLKSNTLFSMIFLMIIGGSPGSIAGGLKTTTFFIIICMIYAKFKGNEETVVWKRSISKETIDKSTTLLILAFFAISVSTFLILSFDTFSVDTPFLAILFEMTSAFATVGLSTGITSSMTITGKLITCLVMYLGRLGPLTLITALTSTKKKLNIQHPEENIMIG